MLVGDVIFLLNNSHLFQPREILEIFQIFSSSFTKQWYLPNSGIINSGRYMVNTARTTVFIIVYCIKDSVTNVTKNRRRNTQYFLQYLIL